METKEFEILEKERDYKIETEFLENEIENLRNEIENCRNSEEALRKENESLNNVINEYGEYCKKLIEEIGQLKEESIILMRKVVMYQEEEIRKMKENK